MDVVWLAVLVLLLGGWAVLDGYVLGLGVLSARLARTPGERQLLRAAIGPFFLGNEVWLVAAAGVLSGAFSAVESGLFAGSWPILVAMLAGWLARDAAIWFRARSARPGWRAGWDRVLPAASVLFAFTFGMLMATLAEGLPHGDGWRGTFDLVNPFTLLFGLTTLALFALHGCTFAALRLTGPVAARATRQAARLVPPAAGLLILTSVIGSVTGAVRGGMPDWPAAVVLVLLGLLALWIVRRAGGRASFPLFLVNAYLAALPVLVALVGTAGTLLDRASDPTSLTMLSILCLPVLPVLLAAQVWLWWVFRQRVDDRAVAFF